MYRIQGRWTILQVKSYKEVFIMGISVKGKKQRNKGTKNPWVGRTLGLRIQSWEKALGGDLSLAWFGYLICYLVGWSKNLSERATQSLHNGFAQLIVSSFQDPHFPWDAWERRIASHFHWNIANTQWYDLYSNVPTRSNDSNLSLNS